MGPTEDEPTDIAPLLADLAKVRRTRLGVLPREVPELRRIALEVTQPNEGSESVRIQVALRLAARRLEPRKGEAALLLLRSAEGQGAATANAPTILEQAARAYGSTTESLARHHAGALLEQMAAELLALEAAVRAERGAITEPETQSGTLDATPQEEVESSAIDADLPMERTELVGPDSQGLDEGSGDNTSRAASSLPSGDALERGSPESEQSGLPIEGGFDQPESQNRLIRGVRRLRVPRVTHPRRIIVTGIALAAGALGLTLASLPSSPSFPPGEGFPASGADSIVVKMKLPGDSHHFQAAGTFPNSEPIEWGVLVTHDSLNQLKNAVVIVEIPTGIRVVPGTVQLTNGNYPYPHPYTYPSGAIQQGGRQIHVGIGDYNPLSSTDAAKGLVSAEVSFVTVSVLGLPTECSPRAVTVTAWLGSSKYPTQLHDSATAQVSC